MVVLVAEDGLSALVVRVDHLLEAKPHSLDVHEELADPAGDPGQLLFACKLAHIALVDNLEGDIGNRFALLQETESIGSRLGVVYLESGLELDAVASLMPDVLDALVVEYHVDAVVVVVVVEVEEFDRVRVPDLVVEAGFRIVEFQLQGGAAPDQAY